MPQHTAGVPNSRRAAAAGGSRVRPRFTNLIIAVLIAGVAVGAAFGGGILYGRNTAPTPKTASAAPSTGGTAAGGAGAAAAGAGGGGARAAGTPAAGGRGGSGGFGGLIGAISKVSGNTIDVTTAQGTVVPVQIAPDTRILTSTEGTVADLKPGLIVTVVGQADATGTVPASAIQIQPIGPGQPGPGQPGATPRAGAGQGGQGNRGGQGGRPTATPAP